MRRIITGVITASILLGTTALVIFYGRGYRFDTGKKTVEATGSLVATSVPDGGAVFVNGRFTTATNNTVQIAPGWYQVKITKEGYIPWQKKLKIAAEVVTKTDALLFPTNPALSPLTTVGVEQFVVSPDGSKIAFINRAEASLSAQTLPNGVFILDIDDHILTINRYPRKVLDFSIVSSAILNLPSLVFWSPDSKQLLIEFGKDIDQPASAFLLDVDRTNPNLNETAFQATRIRDTWQKEKRLKESQQLLAYPADFQRLATTSATIISLSPDESKALYLAKAKDTLSKDLEVNRIGSNPTEEIRAIEPGRIYVYDLKEDKNYLIMSQAAPSKSVANQQVNSPNFQLPILWYPDAKHLIIIEEHQITIMEYDGVNRTPVYAGPFIDSFVAPWSSGGKLIILTNLNSSASARPNLYLVNLR